MNLTLYFYHFNVCQLPLNFKSEKRIKNPPDILLNYNNYTELTAREHHYQEERRLFYVAITRAKKYMYILAPNKATSKFVKELPEELMKNISDKTNSKVRFISVCIKS